DTAGKLYADNSLVSWESELHFSNTPTPWTENGASFTFDSGSDLSGEWTSNYDVTFFIVKGSNCGTAGGYAALFAWSSGDKQKSSFDLDDYLEANASAISNIRLYSTDGSTAPIPSAVWLLGSGLSALMVARRRRKKA
ncbi:VPLPA-CTERM sorting domain-containing protein, partial [bacterium]|nr:VPLPA-CTERM sorting domain-containing protein [bacterium]